MSDFEKDFFEKMDREFELNRQIETCFEEAHLLKQWKCLNGYLEKNLSLIKKEMSSITVNHVSETDKQGAVLAFYDNINFHVYNFLNAAFSFREALFLPEKSFSWKSKEKFSAKGVELKSCYSHKVITALRSRIKSGVQLESLLTYEVRTTHHFHGEGLVIGFDLEQSDWKKIKSALDTASRTILESNIKPNYLIEIFENYVNDSNRILDEIEIIFNDVFCDEITKVSDLKKELHDIDTYFKGKGHHRI